MKIKLDENNYITDYVIIGDIEGSIEIEDFSFKEDINCYKYEKEEIKYDKAKVKSIKLETKKQDIRIRREQECFSIINRGKVWYDSLSEKQLKELNKWYEEWLKATDTLKIPKKPDFL